MGQSSLVKYGIEEESSDIRAHVSVVGQCVYVYPTKSGIEAVRVGAYPKKSAYTGSIKTAEGFLIPPRDIVPMRVVAIPDTVMQWVSFQESDSTSVKGYKAVRVVQWLLKNGSFPLMLQPEIIEDVDMQIDGLDIIVRMKARIQVKCDWKAGDRRPGCTGNLFLQVAECNPYKQH